MWVHVDYGLSCKIVYITCRLFIFSAKIAIFTLAWTHKEKFYCLNDSTVCYKAVTICLTSHLPYIVKR